MLTAILEQRLAEAEQRRRVIQLRREDLELLRRLRRVEAVMRLYPTRLERQRRSAA